MTREKGLKIAFLLNIKEGPHPVPTYDATFGKNNKGVRWVKVAKKLHPYYMNGPSKQSSSMLSKCLWVIIWRYL